MRILIIDDSKHIRFQLKTFLENAGYQDLILKESARVAIDDLFLRDRIDEKGVDIDLIIMDVVLPELNGIDAVYELRRIEKLADIPIIIITAKSETESVERAFEAGANDYIKKPLNSVELIARVRSLLKLKEQTDERKTREVELLSEIALRKEIEQKLRLSEEKYRDLTDTATDFILTIDFYFNITHINPAGLKATGYTWKELKRLKVVDLIPKRDIKPIRKRLLKRIGGDDSLFLYSTKIFNKSGQIIPVEFSSSLIKKNNRPEGVLIVARNLTDRLRLEKALLVTKKLEASMHLSAGLAHDLNNLLSGIYSYTQMAQAKAESGSKIFTYIGNANVACERAAKLANQFLAIAKIDAPPLSVKPLAPMLQQFFDGIITSEGIRVEVTIEDDLEVVNYNEGQIRDLLRILINNAKEAMTVPRAIRFTASNLSVDDEFNHIHASVPQGAYVHLEMEDSGSGIQTDHLTKIFDPYFSTKKMGSQKGMGLGLTIAQAIVYHHSGYIMMDSKVGEKTVCRVLLPVLRDLDREDSE